MEEQRRRMAEEERNRRAAQDFSRMSLAGGGGGGSAQASAPHAPQHYPPAYQVRRFEGGRGRHSAACSRQPVWASANGTDYDTDSCMTRKDTPWRHRSTYGPAFNQLRGDVRQMLAALCNAGPQTVV